MVFSDETVEFSALPSGSFGIKLSLCFFWAPKPVPLAPSSRAGYNSLVPSAPRTVRVKVLFFGRLKEIIGRAEDSVDLAEGARIEQLFAHYGARHPELARFRASVVASRNQEFAAWSTPLHGGDEVAFLPPVSGG
jgi:molybdopterin synthase sulfur carrier subunit